MGNDRQEFIIVSMIKFSVTVLLYYVSEPLKLE